MILLRVAKARRLRGQLLYLEPEHQIDFEVDPSEDPLGATAFLTLDSVLLEFSLTTGTLLYVSGYYPRRSWVKGNVEPPVESIVNGVAIETPRLLGLQAGEGLGLLDDDEVTATHDALSGWLLFRGKSSPPPPTTLVEFAPQCVIGIHDATFCGLYLSPTIVGTKRRRLWR